MTDTPTPKRPPQRGQASLMFKYLTSRRNLELAADDIAADLGMTRAQVSGAIAYLRDSGVADIAIPMRGWYVFRSSHVVDDEGPKQVAVDAAARVVSLLADGRLLVDVEGVLYVAAPLVLP